MSLKSVTLDGKRVVVAGFVALDEIKLVKENIKENWPCCSRRIRHKPDLSAIMITAPALSVAQEIFESMRQLFIPITA